MKHFALQLLIIIIIAISAIECQRWSSYNRPSNNNSKQNGRSSAYAGDNGNNKATEANTPAKSQQSKSSVRRGIGAWGIIAITLTIILSGLGVYYFVIFYPIVCKKERMYDVMEMTTV